MPTFAADSQPIDIDRVKADSGKYGSMTLHSVVIGLISGERGLRFGQNEAATVNHLAALLKTFYA